MATARYKRHVLIHLYIIIIDSNRLYLVDNNGFLSIVKSVSVEYRVVIMATRQMTSTLIYKANFTRACKLVL